MPERRGMRTSISTTSGIRSCAFSTASWPSDASPTSSRSSSFAEDHLEPPAEQRVVVDDHHAESLAVLLFVTPGSFRSSTPLRRSPARQYLSAYPKAPLRVRRPLLAVMITELPFELGAHQVDRRGHIVSFGMRTEGLSRDPQRGLDPFEASGPRVVSR